MMEHKFKEKVLWSKLVRNISRNTFYYLADEADRAVGCGTVKSKCGCLIFITTYCRVHVQLQGRSRSTPPQFG